MEINLEGICIKKAEESGIPLLLVLKEQKKYCGIIVGEINCPHAEKDGVGHYCKFGEYKEVSQ